MSEPVSVPVYTPARCSPPKRASVQRELVWMERKIKKLEADAAQCRELEIANGLLASRLEAAEINRTQRERKLRNELAERRCAQQRFELQLEAVDVPASVSVKAPPTIQLGTHLANELQNLLRTESGGQQIAAGRNCDKCCGWCGCAKNAGQQRRTRHVGDFVGWPSLSEEGSLFWVASELEVANAGHHKSNISKSPGVLPAPMATPTTSQRLVKNLTSTANDLVQAAAEAEASVKNQEACLELNLQHFHKKFCQIHAQQEALYTSLAIELFVKREAMKKQATVKGELNSVSPVLRLPTNWDADEDCHTVIACASRLLKEAEEMKVALHAAPDPWATLISQRRHASNCARGHINSLRSELAAAHVAVDRQARPGRRTVYLERRLQIGFEALQDCVKEAMGSLESVAEYTSCVETCSDKAVAGARPHFPMDVTIGSISKCLLTLFCGSSRKANAELAKHKEEHPEESSSEVDVSSCESFGIDAEDMDVDKTPPRATVESKLLHFQSWVKKEQPPPRWIAVQRRRAASAQRGPGVALPQPVKSLAAHRRSETLVRFANPATPKKLLLEALARRWAHFREIQQMSKNDFDVRQAQMLAAEIRRCWQRRCWQHECWQALGEESKLLAAQILQRAKNTTLERQASDAIAILTSETKHVVDRIMLQAKTNELQRQSLEWQAVEGPAGTTSALKGTTHRLVYQSKNSSPQINSHPQMLAASPALAETLSAREPSPAITPFDEERSPSLANTPRPDERKSTPDQIQDLLEHVVESRVRCAISNVVDQRRAEFIAAEDAQEAHRAAADTVVNHANSGHGSSLVNASAVGDVNVDTISAMLASNAAEPAGSSVLVDIDAQSMNAPAISVSIALEQQSTPESASMLLGSSSILLEAETKIVADLRPARDSSQHREEAPHYENDSEVRRAFVANTLGGAAYGGQVEAVGALVANATPVAHAGQVVETSCYGGQAACGGHLIESIAQAPMASGATAESMAVQTIAAPMAQAQGRASVKTIEKMLEPSREELAKKEEDVQPTKTEEKDVALVISRSDNQRFGMSVLEDDDGHASDDDGAGTTNDALASQTQVAKVIISRIYRAAARAERRQVRKVAAKKRAVIEKKMPKRVQCIRRPWRAEDPSQMWVVKGDLVSLWTASVTDDGWIYAEKIKTGGAAKAGWLPTHVLKPLPENRRWMLTVRSWKAADHSQCSVAGGILVLVWTDSRTNEGWAYVETSQSAGSQMGWLPDSCLQWDVQ